MREWPYRERETLMFNGDADQVAGLDAVVDAVLHVAVYLLLDRGLDWGSA